MQRSTRWCAASYRPYGRSANSPPAGKEGHVAVVGLDGTPLALDRIRQGTQDASVGQDPNAMGGFILDVIIGYFAGKPFEAKGSTRPVLITKENVNDPSLWGNFGKKK
jgi:ribose transport system substrate-binding protein